MAQGSDLAKCLEVARSRGRYDPQKAPPPQGGPQADSDEETERGENGGEGEEWVIGVRSL